MLRLAETISVSTHNIAKSISKAQFKLNSATALYSLMASQQVNT